MGDVWDVLMEKEGKEGSKDRSRGTTVLYRGHERELSEISSEQQKPSRENVDFALCCCDQSKN